MTVKTGTHYEVVCDHPGCGRNPDDEFSWFSDSSYAIDSAEDADWGMDGEGRHWCPNHYPEPCETGKHVRDDQDDPCKRCKQWPEDDE